MPSMPGYIPGGKLRLPIPIPASDVLFCVLSICLILLITPDNADLRTSSSCASMSSVGVAVPTHYLSFSVSCESVSQLSALQLCSLLMLPPALYVSPVLSALLSLPSPCV